MADDAPAWDDIPSWDDIPDSQPQQLAAQQNAAPAWDDIPSWDDLPGQPQPEGMLGTAAREAAHGVLPLMGGVAAGGLAGAAGGAIFGVPGAIIGGLGGMVAGSMATNRAQDAVLKGVGIEDDQQREVNAAENPWSSFVGGLLPAVGNPVTAAPRVGAKGLEAIMTSRGGQRAIGALGMGGFEAGQQYLNEGHIDPAKVAAAAAFGAAVPQGNFATKYAHGLGENAAGKIVGRPDMKPGDTAGQTAKDDADTNQSPNVAGNQATEQQAAPDPKAPNPDAQVAGTKVKSEGGENALKTKTANETFGSPDDPNPISDPTLAAGVKGSVGDGPPVVGDNGFPVQQQQAAPTPDIIRGTANARTPEGMSREDAERLGYIATANPPPADRQAAIRAQLDQMPPRDPRRKALVDEHNQLALQNRKQQAAEPPVEQAAPPPVQATPNAEKPKLSLVPKKAAPAEPFRLSEAPEGGVYTPDQINAAKGEKYFKVHGADGNVAAEVLTRFNGDTAHIIDILAPGKPREEGRNIIGQVGLRSVLRQLQEKYPEIKKLAGQRVSGARNDGKYSLLSEKKPVEVNLKKAATAEAPGPRLLTDDELVAARNEQQQRYDGLTPELKASALGRAVQNSLRDLESLIKQRRITPKKVETPANENTPAITPPTEGDFAPVQVNDIANARLNKNLKAEQQRQAEFEARANGPTKLVTPGEGVEHVSAEGVKRGANIPEPKSEIPPLEPEHALTLQRLLDNGWNEMAVHYANATPEDRALMQPHIDAQLPQNTKHSVDRNEKDAARDRNKLGNRTGTLREKEQHNSAIDAIRKAFNEHPPVEGETTEQLIKRLQAAVDTAHTAHGSNPLDRKTGYLPRALPPEFEWFRHVQDNAARKPIYFDTAGKLEAFKAEENLIRSKLKSDGGAAEPKSDKKMAAEEAGLRMSKRGGAAAESQLEKQSTANDPTQSIDEMIDLKRKLQEAGKSPDDIEAIMNHIETEEDETYGVKPTETEITRPEQIKKFKPKKKTLDTLAEKTALPPANEVRRGDVAGINSDPKRLAELVASLDKANKQGSSRTASTDILPQIVKSAGNGLKDLFGNEVGGGKPGKVAEDIGKLFKGTTSIVSRAINNMLKAIREAHPEAPPPGETPPGAKITGKKVYDEPVGPKMARYIAKDIEGNEPAKAGYTIADRMNEAAKTDNSISAESVRLRSDIERRLRGETSYGDTLKRKIKEGVQNKLAELKGTRADNAARDAMQERTKDMYNALETGDRSLIKTEGDQKIFDELMQKQFEVEFIRRQIHEKQANGEWGWVDIGRETEDGVHRIWKNGGELPAVDQWGAHPDPVAGNNPLSTRRGPMTMERPLVVAEGKNGDRHIIHLETGANGKFNGKWKVWKNYDSWAVKDAPDIYFKKLGDTFKLADGREFKLRDATTGEIEHNVLGNDGQPMRAQRDAVASILSSHDYHLKLFNHLQTMADMIDNPKIDNPKSNAGAAFRKYATDISGHAQVQNGEWKKSTTPGFERFWMEDHLREALEDAHQPGINDDALNILRRVSRAGMQTIFWNPVVHLMNVAPHWAVGRGSKWLPGSGGYKDLYETGAQAIKSVLSNDATHRNIREVLAENGYGGIYDGVIAQNSTRKLSLGLGEEIARNPSKWGPIADKLDMTVGDLVRSIYYASKNTMWSGNDMMLTQSILEHLKDMGVKDITNASKAEVKQAIETVEKHLPNYRIPGRIMSSGELGRSATKKLGDPLYTAFGRYGYGMFNSHANLITSVLRGSGPERKEAIGQLMVLGALVYVAHPIYNAVARAVTGNDQAESRPRGPLTIPGHLAQARDTGDIAPLFREGLRLSPLASTVFELARQKDFGGKDIASPAAVRRALGAEGAAAMPGGLANLALHETGHIASSLIAPLGTVNQALNNEGLAAGARDQLLDIKSPSTAEQKFRNQVPRTSAREERYRNIRKKSLADKVLNAFN